MIQKTSHTDVGLILIERLEWELLFHKNRNKIGTTELYRGTHLVYGIASSNKDIFHFRC